MLKIQGLKDSFYGALRDRIAAGNAARTVVVRGVIRPGVLVVENEFPAAAVDTIPMVEVFCLRWVKLAIDRQSAGAMVRLGCEIGYASDGSAGAVGLDRGRALAAMDAELATALTAVPMHTSAETFAEIVGVGITNATVTGTNVFWGEAVFAAAVMRGERMERTAQVEVFGYGE
jgi:hypothetical protein